MEYEPEAQPPFAPSYAGHYRVDEHGQGWVYNVPLGWSLPRWEPVAMPVDPNRSGSDIEKTMNDVLKDLANDAHGKGAVEQIKGAAEGSIKRQDDAHSIHRAIIGR